MFWGIRMNRCLGIVSVMEDGIDTKVQVMMIMRIRGFQALKLREVLVGCQLQWCPPHFLYMTRCRTSYFSYVYRRHKVSVRLTRANWLERDGFVMSAIKSSVLSPLDPSVLSLRCQVQT